MKKILKIFLNKVSSDLALRLEKEFIFLDFNKSNCEEQEFITKDNYIASDCFITPPNKGDFYVVKNVIWEVVSVTHSFGSCNPGYIFLQKQRDLKNGIQEKN